MRRLAVQVPLVLQLHRNHRSPVLPRFSQSHPARIPFTSSYSERAVATTQIPRPKPSPHPLPHPALTWVSVIPGVPYFQTDDGQPFHPIGHNDAISWADLNPLFRRRDIPAISAYLANLAAHGVTTLRLMLEYAQVRHRYIESAPGVFNPAMVRLWDDLFALCAQHGLRILLTPFDTFWTWLHFHHHPYNARHGGPLNHPSRSLLDPATRLAIKARLTFAAERWGATGTLFAWDLWNEIHPAQAEMSSEPFMDFIQDLSDHVRSVELRAHGRAHPQTVSLFGPELKWRPHLRMEHPIFRHPALDFANLHVYEEGTIDHPQNTVDAAVGMGRIVRQSLAEITDTRPFFDSEHGPIHTFKDHKRTLPAPFDDELFRHMQWAHLASGGAGGGMRWPNRKPHRLTPGMHLAQQHLAAFLPLLDWHHFPRTNVSATLLLHTTDPTETARPDVIPTGREAEVKGPASSSAPTKDGVIPTGGEAAVEGPASSPATHRAVISTEGSAQRSRSGETPAFTVAAPVPTHPEAEPPPGAPHTTAPPSRVGSSAESRSPAPQPVPEIHLARFACATPDQALIYLLRRDTLLPPGTATAHTHRPSTDPGPFVGQLDPSATPLALSLTLPLLAPGTWSLTAWDTATGTPIATTTHYLSPSSPTIPLPPFRRDLAVALRRRP